MFITNGPERAIGSPSGRPARTLAEAMIERMRDAGALDLLERANEWTGS